jgi:hypothetical protein
MNDLIVELSKPRWQGHLRLGVRLTENSTVLEGQVENEAMHLSVLVKETLFALRDQTTQPLSIFGKVVR